MEVMVFYLSRHGHMTPGVLDTCDPVVWSTKVLMADPLSDVDRQLDLDLGNLEAA